MDAPPQYQGVIAFVIALAPVLFVLRSVSKQRLDRLRAASLLILWGLVIVVIEHVGFGRTQFRSSNLLTHDRFHHQMLAAYGLVAIVLIGTVVAPLIRHGVRRGWYAMLGVFVIGVGSEVATAVLTTPHGASPRWWSWGWALWAYPVAWATALAISWRPILRSAS